MMSQCKNLPYVLIYQNLNFWHNNVTTRKVNTPNTASANTLKKIEEKLSAVALLQSTPSTPDLLIAQPTIGLYTILVKLEGNIEVEAILDDGSQVISIC